MKEQPLVTNRARIAAFKAKTAALIDTLHLSSEEVVGLGLTLAVAHAGGVDRRQLHRALDQAIDEAVALGGDRNG